MRFRRASGPSAPVPPGCGHQASCRPAAAAAARFPGQQPRGGSAIRPGARPGRHPSSAASSSSRCARPVVGRRVQPGRRGRGVNADHEVEHAAAVLRRGEIPPTHGESIRATRCWAGRLAADRLGDGADRSAGAGPVEPGRGRRGDPARLCRRHGGGAATGPAGAVPDAVGPGGRRGDKWPTSGVITATRPTIRLRGSCCGTWLPGSASDRFPCHAAPSSTGCYGPVLDWGHDDAT